MKGEHSVRLLCGILQVSRSGYYRWRQYRPNGRRRRDAELAARIAAAHRKDNLGHPDVALARKRVLGLLHGELLDSVEVMAAQSAF